jgi:hypothetical protein
MSESMKVHSPRKGRESSEQGGFKSACVPGLDGEQGEEIWVVLREGSDDCACAFNEL